MCFAVIINMAQLDEVMFKRVLNLAAELEVAGKLLSAVRLVSGLSKMTDQEAFVRGSGKEILVQVKSLRNQLLALSRMSEQDMYLSAGLNPPNLVREKPKNLLEKAA